MTDSDFPEFAILLRRTFLLCSAGTKEPDGDTVEHYSTALSDYALCDIRAALSRHAKDPQAGRFPPRVGEIIGLIEAADGHPDAHEAWTIAMRAADEMATVIWTEEIAQAWYSASQSYKEGDTVGASLAFKEAYRRLVREARDQRRRAQFFPCEGHDKELARRVIDEAALAGRVEQSHRLPPPHGGLIELASSANAPPSVMQKLAALRDKLLSKNEQPSKGELDTERTKRLKQISAEKAASASGVMMEPPS